MTSIPSLKPVGSTLANWDFTAVGDISSLQEYIMSLNADAGRRFAAAGSDVLQAKLTLLTQAKYLVPELNALASIDGTNRVLGNDLASSQALTGRLADYGQNLSTSERYKVASTTYVPVGLEVQTSSVSKHVATAAEVTAAEAGTLVSSSPEVRRVAAGPGYTDYTLYRDEKVLLASETQVQAAVSGVLAAETRLKADVAKALVQLDARVGFLDNLREDRKTLDATRKADDSAAEAKLAQQNADNAKIRARQQTGNS